MTNSESTHKKVTSGNKGYTDTRTETIGEYLNPLARLGISNYSSRFPILGTIVVILLLEAAAKSLPGNIYIFEITAILVFALLVVYFSFHDGVLGGSIATLMAVMYAVYFIHTRNLVGLNREMAENVAVVLGLVYLLHAAIVGWLKLKIDELVRQGREGTRRLKTIVEQLPVGIVVRNKKGMIEVVNKQASKILNFRESQIRELLDKLLNKGRPLVNHQYMHRSYGHPTHLQISSVTIRNDENQIVGSAAILNDVTKLKEIEQRKDDFINMASHELKTPITSMKLYLDLLSAELNNLDPEKRQIINSLRLQTKRLQKLASDLVDVSRLQTGKFSIDIKMLELDKLIAETLRDLEAASNNRKIVFAKSIPIVTSADSFRIYQVLTNIVANALKYSPSGSPVYVRLEKKENEAVVSVQDE